ncbi:fatty acid desaturase family protein [Kribbia dieselivorans]|uniref:fatty acid desaturase family protein n=1 Tax=Kribbia dieselivorans TaxID=331526 RepID=UPI0009FAC00E|nr:acyl-CoA desaturase [Kribbia dieselivorans]
MTLAPERPVTETDAATTPARKPANPHLSSEAPERIHTKVAVRYSHHEDPIAHLTPEHIEAIAKELDAIRAEVMDSRGEADAKYIRNTIKAQRWIEMTSRGVLLFSGFWPAWLVGTAGLSIAKIIENMEIGHNVMHGQWDWMRDPKIHSQAWEWDNASPSSQWKYTHNVVHHTFTNVIGRDNDLGYGIMRVSEEQPWRLEYLWQPAVHILNAIFFEYGIALYDLGAGEYLQRKGRHTEEEKAKFREELKRSITKVRRNATRDYLVHPLLSGPNFLPTLAANVVANIVRNLWTNSVIICGHFPKGIEVFERTSIDGETRGEWYLRQMLGSGNISGSWLMHFMTGNLSHQVEHHLYPDMPSNRYAEVSPKVQDLMHRYDLKFVSGPLHQQLISVYAKVFELSLPNKVEGTTRFRQIVDAVKRERKKSRLRKARRARR